MTDRQTGQHKTWTNREGVLNYNFQYQLENGMQGEASHQTPQPRFPVGSEVDAQDVTKDQQYPKLKLSKPGASGGYSGGGRRRDNDSDPVHNAKLQAAGLVQAAMRAGAQTEEAIMELAMRGLRVSDRLKDTILEQQREKTQQQAPPQQPQPWQNGGMSAQGFHQPPGAPPSMRQPLPQNPGANGTWQGSGAPKPQYQEEPGPF